jgi:RNA ligase (TIGR02306 family)
MRKLASVRKISEISKIDGADFIEVATVDGWKVVVKKGEFKKDDTIVYFEIDSFLPVREEFEFLRKSCFRIYMDIEGFRLRTIKLKNQISQGLIMPTSILGEHPFNIGDDVTEVLGVIKYDPPVPAQLNGVAKGFFPSFIPKTDAERIQNFDLEELKDHTYFVSEKLDGTSITIYKKDDNFGVCSRNLELLCDAAQTHWKMVIENDLENKLNSLGRNIAIQGEVIGEGIQKNKYKLKGQKMFVFNIFDIDNFNYLSKKEVLDICRELNIETVPTIGDNIKLLETMDEILNFAEGKSKLNNQTEREGLVWVSNSNEKTFSFKTISNKFLLKNEE